MEEMISRDAVLTILNHNWGKPKGYSQSMNEISELPTVQPKHGKWIEMPYDPSHTKYMCSECGKTIYTNSDYIKEHKFCFSCGAKMEG